MRYASTPYASAKPRGDTIAAIRNRREFDAGNVTGRQIHGRSRQDTGRLPQVWVRDLQANAEAGRVLYVIRSWQTPIAWYVEGDGWVRPKVGYSSFTTRHQGLIDDAIGSARTVPRREHLLVGIDWAWEDNT